jgi:hypothetical protein
VRRPDVPEPNCVAFGRAFTVAVSFLDPGFDRSERFVRKEIGQLFGINTA